MSNNSDLPNTILDIERVELKIAAGLQDRVIQCFGGLVHRDFRRLAELDPSTKKPVYASGVYTRLNPEWLPNLYIAFDIRTG
jgi:glucuronokinase